ncbi:MAG: methyltransferase [Thermosphaera sp.]
MKEYRVGELRIAIYGDVYKPSEDSWLVMKVLDEIKPSREFCIDLGSGTGILGSYSILKKYCKRVVFVDVMDDALISTLKTIEANNQSGRGIVITSIEGVIDNKADMVVTNPPYLPVNDSSRIDIATEGGERGYETIVYFVQEASRVLKQGGVLVLVYSTLSNEDIVYEALISHGFQPLRTWGSKFFYEEIKVVYSEKGEV